MGHTLRLNDYSLQSSNEAYCFLKLGSDNSSYAVNAYGIWI